MRDEDNELPTQAEEQEIEVSITEKKPAKPTKKAATKKPLAKATRAIGKPQAKKEKAPKAKKEKAPKAKKEKAPKAKKEKKEPGEKKVRSAFVLSGTRESIKIDSVYLKHLQVIANELELPSTGHALDKVVGTGLTRLAALAKYGAKSKS
jgi:hypothetical protein